MKRLAIDIGSAFADLAYHTEGQPQVLKHPAGGDSEGETVMQAIAAGVGKFGFSVAELDEIRIASTGALNAVLKRKGARIALLCTQGFGDTLYLARQNRMDLYDPVAAPRAPAFLLDPTDVHEIAGRMDARGNEITPINRSALSELAERIHADKVEAVAVCLLFAHVNPAHELACYEILSALCPDVPISLSHQVDPQPREYERTVSTCLDAWLKPALTDATTQIGRDLEAQGFAGRIFYGDSRGTLVSQDIAAQQPGALLASGPAAAALHASRLRAEKIDNATDAPARLTVDIGSVSCDISYTKQNGDPPLVPAALYGGIPMRRDMVDLHSIALGGRHCAMLHPGGHITFSMQAQPQLPSLDLALRVLGRYNPLPSANEIQLLEDMATGAGWDGAQEAAARIVTAAELEVAGAVMGFAVRRNIDPAGAHLVAMGGLGPVLAPGIAALLSMRQILLPFAPGAAGALGLLHAAPRFEASTNIARPMGDLTAPELAALYTILEAQIEGQFPKRDGLPAVQDSTILNLAATAHMHPLQVTMEGFPETAAQIMQAFATTYENQLGIAPPGSGYVFSIALRRDAISDSTIAARKDPARDLAGHTGVCETVAGTIWVGDMWTLHETGTGFSMHWKEQAR